jgi:alkane 1-monooxygenase
LDQKSEQLFKNDKRFMGPLYAFVFNDWATWVWCLYIVSGSQPWFLPEDYWLFRSYIPQTVGGWTLFTFVWGYMAGVNGLAGHELIHKREVGHKILGTYTYSKILYSHFFYEHNSGHHRNVATPDDPATARKG